MSHFTTNQGVWFIYDGECPICNYTAHALRPKEQYSEIHLIDARTSCNLIIDEIKKRQFDLDERMLIYTQGRFYHGKTTLKFMAQYRKTSNIVTTFCKTVFWLGLLATLLYPFIRSIQFFLIGVKEGESD